MAKRTRAPLPLPGDEGEKQIGRPRLKLDEEVLRRALEAGAEYAAIANANGCSIDTVRRRVREARKRYGKAWGKPLTAPPPPPPPPPRAPVEVDPDEADGKAVVAEAVAFLRSTVLGRIEADPVQLQAVRIALQFADLLRGEGQARAGADHAALLAQVQAATKPPPSAADAPEP